MLKHVAMWKLREPARKPELVTLLADAAAKMRGRIPGLLFVELGGDVGFDRRAHDIVLYAELADVGALEVYQDHPAHLEFKAVIGPLVTDRRAVDWIA